MDDDFGKVKFVPYTQISKDLADTCVQLLEEHSIPFHLYPIDHAHQKDVIFALIKGFDINLIHSESVALTLYIQESNIYKLDKLVVSHPNFAFLNKNTERKLFFETAYTSEGLLGILALPNDWSTSDLELVKDVLKNREILVTEDKLNQARQYLNQREKNLAFSQKKPDESLPLFC